MQMIPINIPVRERISNETRDKVISIVSYPVRCDLPGFPVIHWIGTTYVHLAQRIYLAGYTI